MLYKIYGVSDCPYCLKALALCMEKDIPYVWVDMSWSKNYRDYIKSYWDWKTYPIVTSIHIDTALSPKEDLIGGFTELKKRVYNDI